jgi:bifunctional DNA-binding transcriptional regulator/antitoxin component of YhaV-PrlF toxin-antitoxin module
MNQLIPTATQDEWLRILGKGMVTIPKSWREELGLTPGKVIRAQKTGNKVTLEGDTPTAPYRIFSDKEIREFLKDDKLPESLAKKINKKFNLT